MGFALGIVGATVLQSDRNEATIAGVRPAIRKGWSQSGFLSCAGRNDRARLVSIRALQPKVHPLHRLFSSTNLPLSPCPAAGQL